MNDAYNPANGFHTKVWAMERHLLGSYRELIAHEIKSRKLTLTGLAKQTKISRHSLKRMITGKQELRARDIIIICAALDLERSVATHAIETIGDWRAYYDQTLRIGLGLVAPIVNKINTLATTAMEPLTPSAINELSDRIAKQLVANQMDIYKRRDRIEDPRN